jgi:Phage stabilisation protein
LKTVPLFGSGMAGKSYTVTRQRRLNCYLENRQDGDKAQVVCYGTPGLSLQFTLANIARGVFGTQSALYAVSGSTFYSLASTGSVLYSQSISSNTGLVAMANNATQLLLVDGSAGYIFSSGALTPISAPAFPNGCQTCTFISSRFVVEKPNTQQFWVSDVFDGSMWNSLAFASASQYSDNIVAVDSLTANLVIFSERHVEFWQDVGATPEPFAPILSATSEYGLEARFSRSHVDNSIIYLAHNPQGNPQICRIQGYQVTVISTPDLDYILNSFAYVNDGVSLSYMIDGHPMYQLSIPNANRSFLYDCSTGVWSEVQTGLTAGYAQRHTGNLGTYYAGNTLITDYANGNVYMFSGSEYTDNGTTILRELVSRHANEDFNVFTVDEVYVDMETGVGLNSGQGILPNVSLECSKDNGRTFGTPLPYGLGAMGNYLVRMIWRRFGSARDFVFRLRMTDPVKFVITNAALSTRVRVQ